MCGILGILDRHEPVSFDLYRGAMALQHRGQDGAGITTWDQRFFHRAGKGLLADVFRGEELGNYPGAMGLAHLRYATAGLGRADECQPFLLSFPYGLALVHNGNLTNDAALRQQLATLGHRHVNSASDSETLLHVFADALGREDLGRLTTDGLMQAVRRTMAVLQGAYAVIVTIAGHGLLAFRDPHGFRPLVMGRRGEAVVIASESVALDAIDAELWRDVRPGEAVFVGLDGQISWQQVLEPRPAHCIFEYIYLARPESVIDGRSVSAVREALGQRLAERFNGRSRPEVVCDVPSSAEDSAAAFAEAAEIPYRKGIRRNQYCQRSFIAADRTSRQGTVGAKFLLEKRVIAGRHVAVVDDSIVRGTTARSLVIRLRQQGARQVSFLSASPPVKHPCIYGIDMAVREDLVAGSQQVAQVADYLQVDHLQYQQLDDLLATVRDLPVCTACFTGQYPSPIDPTALSELERGRARVSGEQQSGNALVASGAKD